MRHRRLRGKLGVKTAHRKALVRNLVKSLVVRKRIRTTVKKAKVASAFADQMVTLAKRGDLHAHRQLVSKLGCSETARTLVNDIAPHFKERNGGYTRVLRLGARPGDAAETALLEFTATIEAPEKETETKTKKKKKAAKPAKSAETAAPKKEKSSPSSEKASPSPKAQDRDESEKKGGFLGTLRKFLKGDENNK